MLIRYTTIMQIHKFHQNDNHKEYNVDLYSLRTFICVKQTRSFSKAAQLLFITQPAVSKRIAALEMELGIRLFDRVGKKVLLTEAGDVLYKRAIKMVDEYEDCKRDLSNLNEKVAGRLSFATSHHIGLHRLPPVLEEFNETYPNVDLDISFMGSEDACSAVANGEIELALVTLPSNPMPKLKMITVWKDPLYPVIGSNHPLMKRNESKKLPVSLEKLVTYPVILPGPKTFTFELITNRFSNLGLSLKVKLSSNYLEMIKMLISAGLGWGFLPESMIEGSGLCPVTLERVYLERILGVVVHKQRTLSRGAKEMISMLESGSLATGRGGCPKK